MSARSGQLAVGDGPDTLDAGSGADEQAGDSEDFMLRPGEAVEVKYHMPRGAVMLYGWKANGKLRFEFHGEPDQKPNKEYYERYELNDQAGVDRSCWFIRRTDNRSPWLVLGEQDRSRGRNAPEHSRLLRRAAKMFSGEAPEELPMENPK